MSSALFLISSLAYIERYYYIMRSEFLYGTLSKLMEITTVYVHVLVAGSVVLIL